MKKAILILIFLFWIGGAFEGQHAFADEKPKRILIDEYYAQELTNTVQDATIFMGKLLALGYTADINKEKITEGRLDNYDILILQNPARVLEREGQEAILAFVKRGGGFIVMGQWTRGNIGWNDISRESFNQVTQNFGITFEATAVDDNTNKAGCHCTPIIHNIKPHKTTENIKTIVMYWPCSLSVADAVVLATGDDDTQALGIQETQKGEGIILAAAAEYGKGRVVVLGSSGVFQDRWTQEPEWDNLAFALNVISWVGENAGKGQIDFVGPLIAILYILFVVGIMGTIERIRKVKEKGK